MNANAHINGDSLHRDPDHTIDRALSALRDAQPRSGSEVFAGRILASLDHRATVLGGPSFHGLIVKGWGIARGSARENARRSARLTLWTATSAALLAIASLLILHRELTVPNQRASNAVILSGARSAQSNDPDAARRARNSEAFSTTNLARITHTVSSRPEHRSNAAMRSGETCIPDHHQGCPIHDGGAAVGMGGVSTTPTDAQALADLHAPSHPAPPLPLTPQEKLFLRMLRYGNATELAELNPLVRAQHDADETTEFKAFFPDPPPLKQPLGDTE